MEHVQRSAQVAGSKPPKGCLRKGNSIPGEDLYIYVYQKPLKIPFGCLDELAARFVGGEDSQESYAVDSRFSP